MPRDRLCALERAAVEQRRRDTRGPEGVAIGRLSGRGPLARQVDGHAIQADAEITRVWRQAEGSRLKHRRLNRQVDRVRGSGLRQGQPDRLWGLPEHHQCWREAASGGVRRGRDATPR